MGATKELPFQSLDSQNAAFADFKEHTNGHRTNTELTVLELLRKTHPSHHVTTTDPKKCELLEFAAAGNATAALNPRDDAFDATRTWKPVGQGVEKKQHPGKLHDHVKFGCHTYSWESRGFLVYEVEWTEMLRAPTRMYYVLSARSDDNTSAGHSEDTDALLLAAGKWTSQLHEEIYVFDNAHWSKNRELWAAVAGSSWDEVILDATMKASLIEDVQGFFDAQALYREFAVPWKRGIIFHGVPGNGKTISIKALMCALYNRPDPIPSLYVKSFENCKGPQVSIRSIFTQARASAPCLLVFEDLDSLVQDETRSYFLNEVDGLESNDGILMIGSTNHLDKLDPAISKRPSRFDRKYHYRIPGAAEREAYVAYWREKLERNGNGRVEFPEGVCKAVAELTEGFSFAYLKELFVMALLTIARGRVVDEEEEEILQGKDGKGENPAVENGNLGADEEKAEERKEEEAGDAPCTCCKAHPKPDEKGAASSQNEKKEAKKHRTMPDIVVPEELRDNVLLKVIRRQIRILLSEMDNTDEEELPSAKAQAKPKTMTRSAALGAARKPEC